MIFYWKFQCWFNQKISDDYSYTTDEESDENDKDTCFDLILDQYLKCLNDKFEKFRHVGSIKSTGIAMKMKQVQVLSDMFETLLVQEGANESDVSAGYDQDYFNDDLNPKQ